MSDMRTKQGRVCLVGAGCGEADLITLRGAALLRACDVVVYDSLIDPALLAMAPPAAEKLYMGKRSGGHSAPQPEICAMLIEKAREGKRVVRLKGGDPFLFGRGGEEMLALGEAGVPCEEVPGVSSAIAVPAGAGIPVTHRGVSQSLHIVTARTAGGADGFPDDFDRLAGLKGTLVFLMGLSQLPLIVRRLTAAGMSASVPAAVISGGNAPRPVTVRGTLENIAGRAAEAQVRSPATVVVGGVAALDVSSALGKPLAGVGVGLTGTEAVTSRLAGPLRALGARAFLAQEHVVEELPLPFPLSSICTGAARWLAFTSSNGVRLFFRRLASQKIDLRRLSRCKFAVIGAATGNALAQYGILADLCPAEYTSRALGRALIGAVAPGEEVLLFRSALAGPEPVESLRQAGIAVRDATLYTVRPGAACAAERSEALPSADYLVFCSAGGVKMLFDEFPALPERAVSVCIGDVTAAALGKRTDRPFLIAPDISADGVIRAILDHRQAGVSCSSPPDP